MPHEKCPHFPRCGGCTLIDKSYDEQLKDKQQRLTAAFSFWKGSIPDILPSPVIDHYRHKVQLPFGVKRSGRQSHLIVGCYARDSHTIVDQHACPVQDRDLTNIAWAVRDWANASALTAYDETKHAGFLRHVLLRKGAGTGEVLLGLVTNGPRPVGSRRLAASLLDFAQKAAGNAKIAGIIQNVNTRRTNVVLGEQEFVWWGRPWITEMLGPWRFSVGLSTFFQVNPFQMPQLYDQVLRWIENGPAVLDLYCGVGSISLWVAKKCRYVTGIEENGASIASAKRAASANHIRNARFLTGSVEEMLPRIPAGEYDAAILDPPRKGLDPAALASLRDAPLKRIIYVSCNPDSLARDIKALGPDWKLISVQGVDMFPHTEHIEAVAVLNRTQS